MRKIIKKVKVDGETVIICKSNKRKYAFWNGDFTKRYIQYHKFNSPGRFINVGMKTVNILKLMDVLSIKEFKFQKVGKKATPKEIKYLIEKFDQLNSNDKTYPIFEDISKEINIPFSVINGIYKKYFALKHDHKLSGEVIINMLVAENSYKEIVEVEEVEEDRYFIGLTLDYDEVAGFRSNGSLQTENGKTYLKSDFFWTEEFENWQDAKKKANKDFSKKFKKQDFVF